MKRLLLDLNVVLDVLLDRPPHAAAAAAVWATVERNEVEGLIPAHGITTIFYLASRHAGASFARRVVGDMVSVFRIAPVDEAVIRRALALPWEDFDHAVCAAAAEAAGCDAIVTRDPAGFPDAALPVVDAPTAAALLERGRGPGGVAEGGGRPYAPASVASQAREPKRRPSRPARRARSSS